MKAKVFLDVQPRNVALAREWVFEKCRQFGLKGPRLMDIKTITSEVVTNVVKHAYYHSKRKDFLLKIRLIGNKLSIIVKDFGSGYKIHRSRSLHVGLFIVNCLADRVKIRSLGLGCRVKAVMFLKESELRRPLASRFSLINKLS